MTPLPQGITGMRGAAQEPPSTLRAFTAACFAAARVLNGRVVSTREAEGCNFHEAVLSLQRVGTVRVLCNAYAPFVAFAAPRSNESDLDLSFVDCAPLAHALEGQWTVLAQEALQEPLTPEILALLGDEEQHEIQYWKPQTIDQVIFNFWD